MVSKKILSVAIASAFLSVPSFAADFTLASGTASLKVAKSSLLSTGEVEITAPIAANQGAAGKYYVITNSSPSTIALAAAGGGAPAGDGTDVIAATQAPIVDAGTLDLDVTGSVGIGLAADQKLYVRVELTNAVFKTAASTTDLVVSNLSTAPATAISTTNTVSQGGQVKDKVAVFTVSPTAGGSFRTADKFFLKFANLATSGSGDVGVKVTFHSDIVAAVNAQSALSTSESAAVVKVVEGVKTTVTPSTITADADALFKKIKNVNYATQTELAKIEIAPEAGVNAANGTTLTFGDLFDVAADKSVLTLAGDFSNADYAIAAGACGTTFKITESKDDPVTNNTADKLNVTYKKALGASGLGLVAAGTTADLRLCVKKEDDGKVLSPVDFTATIAYDKVGVWAAPTVSAVAAGSIKRDGTTVEVPYLTTFADYNQRLVLVNRGSTDAAYTISFTPDVATGATSTAGTAATGTLKAGKTTVLKATDIVTITGSSRTAATVTIVGPDAKISAATTQVNLSDKSTDTVKLN